MDPLPLDPERTDGEPVLEDGSLGRPISLFLDDPPGATGPRPPLDGDVRTEIAVAGAGITGLTTALLLAREGREVTVVDWNGVGSGATGNSSAKVTSQHGLTYAALTSRYGNDAARTYASANESAKERIAGLAEECAAAGIDTNFRRRDAYLYAADETQRGLVEAETRAAQTAGLAAELTEDVPLPFMTRGAMRLPNQAEFHSQAYVLGLARLLEQAGGRIYEGTVAQGVSESGTARLRTSGGSIAADHIVVATLMPFLDRGAFFARAFGKRSYVVSARLARDFGPPPEAMLLSAGSPLRSVRWQPFGGEELLMVGGESHDVGGGEADLARYAHLAEFARRHWPVEAIEHRWSAQDFIAADEVPFVGRLHPLTRSAWVATGLKKWGMTGGTVAAELIRDGILGRDNRAAKLFSSLRASPRGQGPKTVVENMKVGAHFVGDRLRERGTRPLADLGRGEGAIVAGPSGKVAGYRDLDGALHAVSALCTHLGCQLRFNAADVSWDCPCHASRFSVDGKPLNGPATEPLAREPTGEA